MIYECNIGCKCKQDCKNRVIQRGPDLKLVLFKTNNRGWGVKTLRTIKKGTFIGVYSGELITTEDSCQRKDDTYLFNLSFTKKNKDDQQYVCDAKFYGNFTRFINHSCQPNVIGIRSFTLHQDTKFPHISFFALEKIPAKCELTLNYGDNYWLVKCKRDKQYCLCKSAICRFTKRTFHDTYKQAAERRKKEEKLRAASEEEEADEQGDGTEENEVVEEETVEEEVPENGEYEGEIEQGEHDESIQELEEQDALDNIEDLSGVYDISEQEDEEDCEGEEENYSNCDIYDNDGLDSADYIYDEEEPSTEATNEKEISCLLETEGEETISEQLGQKNYPVETALDSDLECQTTSQSDDNTQVDQILDLSMSFAVTANSESLDGVCSRHDQSLATSTDLTQSICSGSIPNISDQCQDFETVAAITNADEYHSETQPDDNNYYNDDATATSISSYDYQQQQQQQQQNGENVSEDISSSALSSDDDKGFVDQDDQAPDETISQVYNESGNNCANNAFVTSAQGCSSKSKSGLNSNETILSQLRSRLDKLTGNK